MKYPENERILVVRPCLKTICLGVKPAAKLLSALLYQARNCSDEEPSFTIQWTQEQVTRAVCEEFTSKTLHDTAIPCLELLGYLEVDTSSYVYQYTLHLDLIHRALEVYSTPVELEKFLIVCIRSQLEKVLIELEKLPNQLEEVLIQLEKLLIVIRKTSNSKRGRKVKPQANSEAISENPRLLEIDNITKREEESESEQFDTTASAPSLSLDAALSLSDTHSKLGDAHGSADSDMADMALNHAQHLSSVSDCRSDEQAQVTEGDRDATLPVGSSDRADTVPAPAVGDLPPPGQDLRSLPSPSRPVLQAEAAPEIDEEWCNAETEHRLPAIPKFPPGGTSHEQNRDASPRNEAGFEADLGAVTSAPIPPALPEVSPPRTMRATVVSPNLPAVEPKPARRRKKGELDEVTQKRVESVIAYLDALKQEVMEDPETYYKPSPTDIDAVVKTLLPQNPTEKRVRLVFFDMWNETDRDGNHFWRKHMQIHNVCKQYESRIMGLLGKDKRDSNEPPANPYGNLKVFDMAMYTRPTGTAPH